jgi:hypothetical protein
VNVPARVLLVVLAAVLVRTPAAQPRHGGLASWPNVAGDGEGGCFYRWYTTASVPAYAEPNTSSRQVRTVEAGRRIDPNDRTASLRVLRAYGRVRTRRAFTLQAITAGRRADEYLTTTLTLPAGAVLETMWFAGTEGSDFRYRAVEYRADVPAERWQWAEDAEYRRDFEAVRYPVVENWVRLVLRGARPAAWVNVSGAGVSRAGSQCDGDSD